MIPPREMFFKAVGMLLGVLPSLQGASLDQLVQKTSLVMDSPQAQGAVETLLSPQDLQTTLEQKLSERLGRDVRVAHLHPFPPCPHTPVPPHLENWHVDERSHTFQVELLSCQGRPTQEIQGRFKVYVDIPVLSRPLTPQQLISEQDITLMRVPLDQVHNQTIQHISELIGAHSAQGSLPTMAPLMRFHVKHPYAVKNGQLITVSYVMPKLSLMIKAKALQDGHKGDYIRVQNLDSKQIIEATIDGAGHACVHAMPGLDA
jgi:flagella basal body P-ring formation protein FlgA